MNARLLKIPNSFISLVLIALFTAALATDQARANLHATARASTAFEANTDEYPESVLTAEGWCQMHRESLYADFVTFRNHGRATGFARDASLYRYATDLHGGSSKGPYAPR